MNGQRWPAAGGWVLCLALVLLLVAVAVARGKGSDHLQELVLVDQNGGHGEPNSFKAEKITRPGGRKDRRLWQ